MDTDTNILAVTLIASISGAFGGLVGVLYGLKRGHYKNNRYSSKLAIEIFGSSLTATFITPLIAQGKLTFFLGFLVGIAWGNIVQIIRNKITKIVEAALGETLEKGDA
jgi:hypothetical protein